MPTPEAVELEQPGVHYQFLLAQNSVQVIAYSAHRRAASVRVRVESQIIPETLDDKVRWLPSNRTEWSLAPAGAMLALTAVARNGGEPPSDIVLLYEGAKSLALDALGNLLIVTESGDLRQQAPAVFNARARLFQQGTFYSAATGWPWKSLLDTRMR